MRVLKINLQLFLWPVKLESPCCTQPLILPQPRKGRELKRLTWSVNYKTRERSISQERRWFCEVQNHLMECTKAERVEKVTQNSRSLHDWKVDMVCLQETKLEFISLKIIRSLWGCHQVGWQYIPFH